MSRPLILFLLGVVILTGCVAQPPVDSSGLDSANTISRPPVDDWLDQLDTVEKMETPEIMQQLDVVDKNGSADQLFYYGALNQRLQNYGAWTVARDTFQTLEENQSLPKQQRQLASLLRLYNQSRINAHARYNTLLNGQTEMQESLIQAEGEKRQLELKIQALTELETAISTRQEE